MAQFFKQGDTASVVRRQLRWDPAPGEREAALVDLSTSTGAVFVFKWSTSGEVVHAVQAGIETPALGIITTLLPSPVAARIGLWYVDIEVSWADGSKETWPRTPRAAHDTIAIVKETPMPDVIAPATTGSNNAGTSPVWLLDSETGSVVADHQLVLAGANVVINVPSEVTEFRVSEYPGQTPWADGTTPTIVLAGTSLEAGGPAKLADSNGDLVTIARTAGGSTWYVVGPSAVGLEIGYGAALPADGSTYQLFEIEGSTAVPPLPNGLYRYDDEASSWVQE